MTNHKRSQTSRDRRNVVFMFVPGLWVEPTPYEVDDVVDGVNVHAELDWDLDRREVFIESLEISAGSGVIGPEVLRAITLPRLLAKGGAAARLWVDPNCTEPFNEARLPDETLEQWAARLYFACVVTRRPPADCIAEAQGITIGSAYQRLTVCRKMGLLDLAGRKENV